MAIDPMVVTQQSGDIRYGLDSGTYQPKPGDDVYLSSPEFVLSVLRLHETTGSKIWQYIPPALQNDREFILKAARTNGNILEYLAPEWREDAQIIEQAIRSNNGFAEKFVPEKFKADPDMKFAMEIAASAKLSHIGDMLLCGGDVDPLQKARFDLLDTNGDNIISPSEAIDVFRKHGINRISQIDTNGDGVLVPPFIPNDPNWVMGGTKEYEDAADQLIVKTTHKPLPKVKTDGQCR